MKMMLEAPSYHLLTPQDAPYNQSPNDKGASPRANQGSSKEFSYFENLDSVNNGRYNETVLSTLQISTSSDRRAMEMDKQDTKLDKSTVLVDPMPYSFQKYVATDATQEISKSSKEDEWGVSPYAFDISAKEKIARNNIIEASGSRVHEKPVMVTRNGDGDSLVNRSLNITVADKMGEAAEPVDDLGGHSLHKTSNLDAKVRGVCYCRSDKSWTAWWTEKGRNRKKAFKLSLYGYLEARRLAIAYRRQIEERLPELRLSKGERKVSALTGAGSASVDIAGTRIECIAKHNERGAKVSGGETEDKYVVTVPFGAEDNASATVDTVGSPSSRWNTFMGSGDSSQRHTQIEGTALFEESEDMSGGCKDEKKYNLRDFTRKPSKFTRKATLIFPKGVSPKQKSLSTLKVGQLMVPTASLSNSADSHASHYIGKDGVAVSVIASKDSHVSGLEADQAAVPMMITDGKVSRKKSSSSPLMVGSSGPSAYTGVLEKLSCAANGAEATVDVTMECLKDTDLPFESNKDFAQVGKNDNRGNLHAKTATVTAVNSKVGASSVAVAKPVGSNCTITVFADNWSAPSSPVPLNVPGIYFNRSRCSIVAFVKTQSKKKYKTFPVRNYESIEAARVAALNWRNQLMEQAKREGVHSVLDDASAALVSSADGQAGVSTGRGGKWKHSDGSWNAAAYTMDEKDSIRGISFSAVNKAWCAQWCNSSGAACLKSFSVSKYGFEEAKILAMKHRQGLEASSQVGSRIPGVIFEDNAWKAMWKEPSGESRSVTFTVGKNGFTYDSARRLAIACRKNQGNLNFLHGWDYTISDATEDEPNDASGTSPPVKSNRSQINVSAKPLSRENNEDHQMPSMSSSCSAVNANKSFATLRGNRRSPILQYRDMDSKKMEKHTLGFSLPNGGEEGVNVAVKSERNRKRVETKAVDNFADTAAEEKVDYAVKWKRSHTEAASGHADSFSAESSPSLMSSYSPTASSMPNGVFYDDSKRGFYVSWSGLDGDIETQLFSVQWSGYNAAKQMAIMFVKDLQRKGYDIKLWPLLSDVQIATPAASIATSNISSPSITLDDPVSVPNNGVYVNGCDSAVSPLLTELDFGLEGDSEPSLSLLQAAKEDMILAVSCHTSGTSTDQGQLELVELADRVSEKVHTAPTPSVALESGEASWEECCRSQYEPQVADSVRSGPRAESFDGATDIPFCSETTISEVSPVSSENLFAEDRSTKKDVEASGFSPLVFKYDRREETEGLVKLEDFQQAYNLNPVPSVPPELTQSLLLRIQGMQNEQNFSFNCE